MPGSLAIASLGALVFVRGTGEQRAFNDSLSL